jgi:hypothetical protein
VLGALDNQHLELRMVPFQNDACGRARERATHDDDIVLGGRFHEVKKRVVVRDGWAEKAT